MNSNEEGSFSTFKTAPRVDLNRTAVSITYAHDAVHRDIMVNATNYQADGTGEILYLLTCAADREVHLEYLITAGGAIQALFYESPVVATAGTQITETRLYRPSAKSIVTGVTVGGSVTGGDYGTLLKHQYNGGGGAGGNIRGGSATHDGAEWVLKVGTTYALRIIRAVSQVVGVEFEWYEVPPYGGRQ